MINGIFHELSSLFTSLKSDHDLEVYKLHQEIDRLHATLNEYRESEIVFRAKIEELEEMLEGEE